LDASLTIGFYAVLRGVLYFVFGNLKESKFSRKFMISFGYFMFFVGYVIYMLASNVYHVLIIQGLLAFGEVVINPSWSAVIANALTKGKERSIYSDFYGYRAVAEGGAAILGGVLATQVGFNVLFTLMAVFALTASILSLFLDEKS
jgi:MFS family permease